jgi:peptidoglycan/LPS O-acetylase OafA/YrhL
MPPRYHISLDGWRGIAAILVALHHFPSISPLYSSVFIKNSWLFVDFFFVLSGFVIAANYSDKLGNGFSISKFMALRLGRLYPLHFVMLIAFIGSEALFYFAQGLMPDSGREYFAGKTSVAGIFSSLTLTQGWGFHEGLVWNGVAWSISTEIFAYFIFAILALLFPRYRNLSMILLVAFSAAIIALQTMHIIPTDRFIDIARCLMGFAMGVLLNTFYVFAVKLKLPETFGFMSFTAFEIVVTGFAIGFVMLSSSLPSHILTAFAFAPAVFIFAFDRGLLSKILSTRLFVLLGTLSYSIYLIHPFVQSRVMLPVGLLVQKLTRLHFLARNPAYPDAGYMWGSSPLQAHIITLVMLVFIVFLSYWTYRLIETPSRDAVKRFLSRKPYIKAIMHQPL